MTSEKHSNSFYPQTIDSWRQWLVENSSVENGIWIIFYHKNSGNQTISYNEAVDQALCFGWIDSKPNKRDHQSSYRYFAPRNPKSSWSRVNKQKIDRLNKAGLMHPSGSKLVEIAKENGSWTALDEVEKLIVPEDLKAEFNKYGHANNNWNEFPRSVKRSILEWIMNAKRLETRIKRISETAQKADKNIRANQYRP